MKVTVSNEKRKARIAGGGCRLHIEVRAIAIDIHRRMEWKKDLV